MNSVLSDRPDREGRPPSAQSHRTAGALLVAHGSRDPRAAPVAHEVARAVEAARPDLVVRAAFLELCPPDPAAVLTDLAGCGVTEVTVVPFLLGHAYHAKVDLPDVTATARERGLAVRTTGVLGPDSTLADLLARRLVAAAGSESGFDAIVVAAAGSSDPEGNAGAHHLAERLGERFGVPASAGFATAAQPTVADAVRAVADGGRRVAVATYVLAPGYFADRIRDEAEVAGAIAIADPLGTAAEIVEVVKARVGASDRATVSP